MRPDIRSTRPIVERATDERLASGVARCTEFFGPGGWLLSSSFMRLSVPPLAAWLALLPSGCELDGPSQAAAATPAPIAPEPERSPEPRAPERHATAERPTPAQTPQLEAEPRAEPPAEPKAEPKAERLELTFVGDIIFGRYRSAGFVPIVADPTYDPFAEIRSALTSDVVVGNLETPVVEELPTSSPIDTPYRFGGSRAQVRGLLGDFTILSLANNHYFDLGVEGQRQSPRILAEEGIVPIGAARTEAPLHRVETHVAKGWRIGLIAVTTLLNVESPAEGPQVPYVELDELSAVLLPLVLRARVDHDLVVVVVHWGDEYFEAPSRGQKRAAHALLEGGVDMVIGHHPHVLQAIERHGDGLVAYSLGNFLFEHTTSKPRLLGVLRTAWQLAPGAAEPYLAAAVLHTAINERSPHPHPAPAKGKLATQVRERIAGLSAEQGTRWRRLAGTEDLRLVLE